MSYDPRTRVPDLERRATELERRVTELETQVAQLNRLLLAASKPVPGATPKGDSRVHAR